MHKERYNSISRAVGYGLLVLVIFVIGAYVGTQKSVAQFLNPGQSATATLTPAGTQDLSEFWSVWNLIQQKYPFTDKAPADKDKVYGAISGLVQSYKDPYTIFFPPEQAKLFDAQVKGSFGGVGMEVGIKDGFITVVAPLKGSPAEKAGIKSGDIVTEINSKKTDSMSIDQAVSLIRGELGTTVDLAIARKGAGEIKHYTITRDTVSLPVVDTSEKGDVFIISFYSFSEDSANLFKAALQKFADSGKQKLVIDLRNNPGGYLDSAIDIASYFLPAGKTVVKENSGPKTPEVVHQSRGYTLLPSVPKLAILINGGSASASEILSGALSEQKVATLIGATSFGKGSVQEVVHLDDGSSLKITVAKWFTPNGVSISEKGITPDIAVEDKPVKNPKTGKYSDPQLEAALKFLDK